MGHLTEKAENFDGYLGVNAHVMGFLGQFWGVQFVSIIQSD